ncbi:gibberellin 2-beta-dioxygenase 2-like [Tripterygium wilfordii]|uniref:gibberellin 2beta-dioxygenase n=1 Tax=Tripterygium wilfordii TaxID=458696 RepID=A0A7J7E0C6_TRIWF|nr:gibberellin 2-beta-dioxygenase 2-like [Tripterygium wilfordii]KAF5752112.1 gibberellin 2-beta-dioxygenase 2-like [Tripterygium wilfordii]
MVVASAKPVKGPVVELPTVDLSCDRTEVGKVIVKACEEYGFFKVINHGVSQDIVDELEEESLNFFSKPVQDKQRAGPANPFGYGFKNIGFNGDIGEVEYLLLNTNITSIFKLSKSISTDPSKFSYAVTVYIEAVKKLACEILELVAEGLRVPDTSVFSRLIRDVNSDSIFRLNHYPPSTSAPLNKIGFGEHSDPQILTILRANDVGGLQIYNDDVGWVPVRPDPNAFFVNVGDVLQAITNGRFVSVRHRALTNSAKSRVSMAYFGAPSLQARISVLPEMLTPHNPCRYRPFTWAEYKKACYSLRLGAGRLDHFRMGREDAE